MSTRINISSSRFYTPFAYYYHVRLRTPAKLLSWMALYVLPTAFYTCVAAGTTAWITDYVLMFIAIFTLYEIGYIHNDSYATLKEAQPSQRLGEESLSYCYCHFGAIVLTRVAISTLLLGIMMYRHCLEFNWWAALAAIALILPLFLLYNHCRSVRNVFLYPVLVFSRYLPFLIPYLTSTNAYLLLLLFISFPLLNALERFSMPRYRYPLFRRLIPTEDSKTLFRVVYYILIALIAGTTCYALNIRQHELIPIYALGIYRIVLYIITLFYTPKNYLQG